jgi:hypothetical protein
MFSVQQSDRGRTDGADTLNCTTEPYFFFGVDVRVPVSLISKISGSSA